MFPLIASLIGTVCRVWVIQIISVPNAFLYWKCISSVLGRWGESFLLCSVLDLCSPLVEAGPPLVEASEKDLASEHSQSQAYLQLKNKVEKQFFSLAKETTGRYSCGKVILEISLGFPFIKCSVPGDWGEKSVPRPLCLGCNCCSWECSIQHSVLPRRQLV